MPSRHASPVILTDTGDTRRREVKPNPRREQHEHPRSVVRQMAESKVDVHSRTLNARHRNNGQTGRLQAVEQSPDVSLWERIKNLFPQPEVLDVAGRSVKGFVIPGWAAGVLLAAMLGGMGFMYSRMSDQRDMLIRLDTQLQERDKHELEYRAEFKTKLNVQQLQIDNMTNRLGEIKILLSPAQVQQIERTRKATQ